MRVRRTTENGVNVYHLAEVYPRGVADKIRLWRTDRGYFGEITHRKGADPIAFDEYRSWGELKADVIRCLYELQYPQFDEESELRPPLLRRVLEDR